MLSVTRSAGLVDCYGILCDIIRFGICKRTTYMHKFCAVLAIATFVLAGCTSPEPVSRETWEVPGDLNFGKRVEVVGPVVSDDDHINSDVSHIWLQIGQCAFLNDGNITIGPLPSGSCIVHDMGTRFCNRPCQDASPGSCMTDLGDGNVVLYDSPC